MQAASVVQKNGAEAQAELSLCKLQMNHAQQDIKRAQDVMRTLEVQRDDAERAATRARAAARKLHIEKMSILAREEGREEGYEMGFRHGQTIATAKRDLSRGLPGAPPQPSQPQTRRRRESLDPVRSIQLRLPEGPAVQSLCPSPRNHPPPRRPASAMSVSSSRLVSAPPVVTQQASRSRTTSIDGSHRASSRAGHSSAVIETGNSTATPQQNIRNSSVSRHSLAFPSGAAVAAAAPNNIHQTRRRSASAFELESGLGSGPPPMPTDTMMPRTIYMYPPPPVISVMPRHIPMPPLPAGAMPMPSPVRASAQPLAPLLSQPQSQFEVERPEHRDTRRRRPSPPASARCTSPHSRLVAGGRADESAMARERDPVPAMGLGLGWEREQRELSVILEDAAGSPGGSQLGNSWEAHPPRQRTPWGDGSSTYSDPRGIEEWRRGTDEEAPRNALPPPSPLTSPGMLRPYDTVRSANMHPQPSQESFGTDLHRWWTGSSSHTVNITIIPPSRPASVGHSAGSHGSDEDEDDQDDDEDDDDESDTSSPCMPPGVVLGPLPAFAQGVTYRPGFVRMSPPSSVAVPARDFSNN
ncbi:hypothetical protein B0H10DRAFT_2029357 [Mycena sp. CBHHK59/15]|nr:hypothetical protein B0H10DRAFT_2029357 [Mycena sp. CBHHK59/15]